MNHFVLKKQGCNIPHLTQKTTINKLTIWKQLSIEKMFEEMFCRRVNF